MIHKILFHFILFPCGDIDSFSVKAIIAIIVNPDCDRVNYLYFIIFSPLDYGMCTIPLHAQISLSC